MGYARLEASIAACLPGVSFLTLGIIQSDVNIGVASKSERGKNIFGVVRTSERECMHT